MKAMLKKFWSDEAGFVVTVEMVLVASILVIGLVTGLVAVRDSILAELSDTANAFGTINQSFAVGAVTQGNSATAAITYNDGKDGNTEAIIAVADGTAVTVVKVDDLTSAAGEQ